MTRELATDTERTAVVITNPYQQTKALIRVAEAVGLPRASY